MKNEVIRIISNMGFSIFQLKRNQYIVNDKYNVLLKYSIYDYNTDSTRFNLSVRLVNSPNIDFIIFIIQDSHFALVTPINILRVIQPLMSRSQRNLAYTIHINPNNYFIRGTNTDLSPYLNNYRQLR